MLLVTCPITGTQHSFRNFGAQTHKLDVLHPLLLADLEQLMRISYPFDAQEQFILTVAYLWQINHCAQDELLVWQGKLARENFSSVWLTQIHGTLKAFLSNLHLNANTKAVSMFPKLRIDSTTTSANIQSWLEVCNQIRKDYAAVMDYDKASTAGKLFAAHVEAKHSSALYTDNYSPENTQRVRQAKSLRNYIAKSFANFEQEKVALIGKVIFRPDSYEIVTIKQVKYLVLEHGLEQTLEEHNYKQNIILKLDSVLVEKLTILEALDLESDDLEELRANYTIEHNGGTYKNSMLSTKFAKELIQKQPVVVAKVYTEEPKREDFTSELGYKAAYRSWMLQRQAK